MTETSFNVSQPRLGAVDTTTGNSGKLHMMVKVDGYDFLSQVTWNRDLKKWAWHFYNHRVDEQLERVPEARRQALLAKLIRSFDPAGLDSLREMVAPATVQRQLSLLPEGVPSHEVHYEHNLIAYFEELNKEYFENAVSVPVMWWKATRRALRRRITFGIFDYDRKEIRMSSRLNQDWVPDYFVKLVLYHEMLHSIVEPIRKDGKTYTHHKEFRARERLFKDFRKAILWERANLRRLMKKT